MYNIMNMGCNDKSYEYIYLLIEREFIKTKEDIYKVGKTKQENFLRFTQYPKGSNLILFLSCKNCDVVEAEILKDFRKHFIQRKDIGNEYFEGNETDMVKHIFNIVFIKDIKNKEVIEEVNEAKEELKKYDIETLKRVIDKLNGN